MSIDDMYRVRQIIDCMTCSDNNLDLCSKLLTPRQLAEYSAKYGCICGCGCSHCIDREGCNDDIDD